MLPFIKSSLPFIAVAVGGGLAAIYIKYRTLAGEIYKGEICKGGIYRDYSPLGFHTIDDVLLYPHLKILPTGDNEMYPKPDE
ncbi:hypothetical protein OROHE_016149 [Orobanche hederae]